MDAAATVAESQARAGRDTARAEALYVLANQILSASWSPELITDLRGKVSRVVLEAEGWTLKDAAQAVYDGASTDEGRANGLRVASDAWNALQNIVKYDPSNPDQRSLFDRIIQSSAGDAVIQAGSAVREVAGAAPLESGNGRDAANVAAGQAIGKKLKIGGGIVAGLFALYVLSRLFGGK